MTINNMSKEQEEKYRSFKDFYSEDLIKTYTTLLDKDKLRDTEFYRSYLNIIKKIVNLLKYLGITDPFCASAIFEYLLWNGYLSKGRKLYYSNKDRVNNLAALGADIMLGKSACLNNADMLATVLSHLDIESYILSCNLPDGKLNLKYRPKINRRKKISIRNMFSSSTASTESEEKESNHAFSLFKSNDTYYIADPTTLAFLNISDIKEAQFVGGTEKVELNADMTLFLNNLTPEEFHNLFVEVFNSKDKENLTTSFIRSTYESVIELCKRNISTLKDFHNDINQDIQTINVSLTKQMSKPIYRNHS